MKAQSIAARLGSPSREGRGWRCRCPVHDGVCLNLADGDGGRLLVKCWAGCDSLDVLGALRELGIGERAERASIRAPVTALRQPDDRSRTEKAVAIWGQARDPNGTIVERYLAGRSLALPQHAGDVIRFHPRCPFKGESVPAMITLLRNIASDQITGVHRTALKPDGTDRDRERGKAMLGKAGGAAIKLSPDAEVTNGLSISEGVESGLALLALEMAPVWVICSAGGVANFPVLNGIEALTIAADHDANGVGDRAARSCALRWHQEGKEARIIRSPIEGEDVADLTRRAVQ